jgi:RNA polymerase sigma factor (sigma-70 family)
VSARETGGRGDLFGSAAKKISARIFRASENKTGRGAVTGIGSIAGSRFELVRRMPPLSRDDTFERVVLPHLDAAYNLARWLMRDPEAAEDVLQEAMVRALTYFASFKGVNPRAWLLQIVRNTAYGSMALNRGMQTVPIAEENDEAGAAELVSGDDDPEAALLRSRESRQVRALIAALPVELRETLVLREFEEFSYKEIAEATQTPIGTVMSRLWRARQLLAQAAAAEGLP